MNEGDKLDKILAIVQKMEVNLAVQQEVISMHRSYFRYMSTTVGALFIAIIVMVIKSL